VSLKQALLMNLKNLIGGRTKRKIVFFSADDYGNVRLDSKSARKHINRVGITAQNQFDRLDTGYETISSLAAFDFCEFTENGVKFIDSALVMSEHQGSGKLVNQSFLKDYPVKVINNEIDLKRFKPVKTESVKKLAALYSCADVFLNPRLVDNFPTTKLEALACGTPVVTYDTGGSPEAEDSLTGAVVPKGDIEGLAKAVVRFLSVDKSVCKQSSRKRAKEYFDKEDCFSEYLALFKDKYQLNE